MLTVILTVALWTGQAGDVRVFGEFHSVSQCKKAGNQIMARLAVAKPSWDVAYVCESHYQV